MAGAARATKERVIGGVTYRVTLLGAKAGRAMSVRLLKLIGPTLASFLEGTVSGDTSGGQALAIGAADALREIAKHVTIGELEAISDELAKFTTVVIDAEHEPQLFAIFDDHFAGRYDCLYGWLAFAIEANFAGFLGGSESLGTLLARARAMIASISTSQKQSIGTSTASRPAGDSARA
jgi:hypothetical protein